MQMGFIAPSLFQTALSRVETQWMPVGICLCILQRSVELRWYHRMDENYERTLCRVHVLWDWDDNRSLSPLMRTLYVLIGFHQPTPSLFHFPRLPLVCYPLSYHSPRAIFLHHTDISAICRCRRKEHRGVTLFVSKCQCALCKECFHKQVTKKKNVLARLNGNVSVIHVQIRIKCTKFLGSAIHRCILSRAFFVTWWRAWVAESLHDMQMGFAHRLSGMCWNEIKFLNPCVPNLGLNSATTGIKKAGLAFVTSQRSV